MQRLDYGLYLLKVFRSQLVVLERGPHHTLLPRRIGPVLNKSLSTPLCHRQRTQARIRLSPSGVHLFDRLSGTNILIDELIPPESAWATAPRQVSIALTNACDLKCPYCFAPKTNATLSYDQIIPWLDELDANGTLGIGFGGGEPTLHPRFADLCAYGANQTKLAVTFTTHGHHLSEAFFAQIVGNIHFIRVSMDGVGATYERLRNRPFKKLACRLAAVKAAAPFGINYVVNEDTVFELDKAVAFAEEAGASEFLLLPEHPPNRPAGFTSTAARELHAWVTRYSGGLPLAISETGADGMPTCNPLPRETGLRSYAHVDANGVLKRSSFHTEGVAIGTGGLLSALTKLNQQQH
jgi:MoaA/NifB/PqqE/SkfB family radical SAM enzyme